MLGFGVDWEDSLAPNAAIWLFNETTGSIVQDLSGNGNTGPFVSDVSWVAGRHGPALEFGGVADYVDISVSLGEVFTIVVDICPVTMDAYGVIVGESNIHGLYYHEGSDKLTYFLNGDHFSDTVIPHDTWSQVAFVRNKRAIEYFLNGVSDGTDTFAADTAFTAEYIGSNNTAEDYKGKMGYVYLYNRALTSSEISDLNREPFRFILDEEDVSIFLPALAPASIIVPHRFRHGNQKPMLGLKPNPDISLNNNLVQNFPINATTGSDITDGINDDKLPFGVSGTIWSKNKLGPCLLLDGVTGIQNTVKANLTDIGVKGSASIWVKDFFTGGDPPQAPTEGGAYFCLHDGTNVNRIILASRVDSQPLDVMDLVISDGAAAPPGEAVWVENGKLMDDGLLHHLGVSWDTIANEYRVFRDGIELIPDDTSVAAASPTGMNQLSLGCIHDSTFWPLSGEINQAAIYNRILTPNEFLQLYQEAYRQWDYDELLTNEAVVVAPPSGIFSPHYYYNFLRGVA